MRKVIHNCMAGNSKCSANAPICQIPASTYRVASMLFVLANGTNTNRVTRIQKAIEIRISSHIIIVSRAKNESDPLPVPSLSKEMSQV